MIRMLGAMVDASERAEELVGALEAGLADLGRLGQVAQAK